MRRQKSRQAKKRFSVEKRRQQESWNPCDESALEIGDKQALYRETAREGARRSKVCLFSY